MHIVADLNKAKNGEIILTKSGKYYWKSEIGYKRIDIPIEYFSDEDICSEEIQYIFNTNGQVKYETDAQDLKERY